MAQPHVFLSHSSKDIAFTRQLEADMRGAGATVYRVSADEGGDFQRRIDEALLACQWVVLVLTTDALASTWVQQEIYAANRLRHDGRIKEILPIQPGAVDFRAIPPLWGVYNIFDASRDYASGRDGLLRALGLQPAPSPVAAPHVTVAARPAAPAPAAPALPTDRFPPRLAQLGFADYKQDGVEYIVPPVVSVAAGEFLMGSDPKKDSGAYGEEKPQHKVTLPGFQIARFPVTVAEYACFVRSGHAAPSRWEYQRKVVDWQAQLQCLDHPVVMVSWNDAIAYAGWLAKVTGQRWRLPNEAEWEKAARWDGRMARVYPWGDSFDASCANTSEGGKGTTTPVGSYPSGTSPCGAQDMSGNVWEWTSSLFKPYPYSQDDGREVPDSTVNRVLRGGSWLRDATYARAAYRNRGHPGNSNAVGGLRLTCAVPNS